MPKIYNPHETVLEAALNRLRAHYAAGDRLIVSISGGKDSTVVMELTILVAREFGRLPVECIMRDEEIMVPGTFEYLERVHARRDDVRLDWVIAGQPIINAYNRWNPYWWVFDPDAREHWVRQPPPFARWIEQQAIDAMVNVERYPPAPGKRLLSVLGLRAQESLTRMNRIVATRGALTKHPTAYGAYNFAPIYDWSDDDVWKAIGDFGWDYNDAYNHFYRIGVPKSRLRIAPPSMRQGMDTLKYLLRLWPKWFDAVETRIPGIRTAARYGRHALRPYLLPGETWEDCMQRLIRESDERAPWMAERQRRAVKYQLSSHSTHSTGPLPQTVARHCTQCTPSAPGSWEGLAVTLYNGDPWAANNHILKPLEPYELRAGARAWYEQGKAGGALHW
jgi:predicted phosphoadenosine phosphosulfate sulfurtransferase